MPSMPTGLNISSNEEEFEILCLKLLRLVDHFVSARYDAYAIGVQI